MSTMRGLNRRNVLRGMLGGSAVTVGLPLLDCFLNSNGDAFASGAPLPIGFGMWFQPLGLQPGQWEPKVLGAKYEVHSQLAPFAKYRDRMNVFSGMKCFVDGKPVQTHTTGPQIGLTGGIPHGSDSFPSMDTMIADVIGSRTRFRSLEMALDGSSTSWSRRSGSAINPSEGSPVALYKRIFGPEFKDPNAAEFTPDPVVMARRSVLSAVTEDRQSFLQDVGTADRKRLDEYFTSLREIEQQLDLELQKPAPLEACTVPGAPTEATPGTVITDSRANGKLFAGLTAHAIACNQTHVFNMNTVSLPLRRAGNPATFHINSHEEAIDPKMGYQIEVGYFQDQLLAAFGDMLDALDGIKEGDHTLLDRMAVLWITDHSYARLHTLDNMPMMTVGHANGKLKTGLHIQATGDSVTRVGLTMMQALGVPLNNWGTESNNTSKSFTEIMA